MLDVGIRVPRSGVYEGIRVPRDWVRTDDGIRVPRGEAINSDYIAEHRNENWQKSKRQKRQHEMLKSKDALRLPQNSDQNPIVKPYPWLHTIYIENVAHKNHNGVTDSQS